MLGPKSPLPVEPARIRALPIRPIGPYRALYWGLFSLCGLSYFGRDQGPQLSDTTNSGDNTKRLSSVGNGATMNGLTTVTVGRSPAVVVKKRSHFAKWGPPPLKANKVP